MEHIEFRKLSPIMRKFHLERIKGVTYERRIIVYVVY
jgi:hypothetical protein